jgi:Amt family ammonium transporter
VHLVGGVIGSLCVGLLATTDTNTLGADGLFYGGGWSLLGKQALAVVSVIGYTFTVTLIIAFVINLFIKLRVPEDQEVEGLDLALHGETAYEFSSLGGGGGTASTVLTPSPNAASAKEGVTA